jgi:4'-phosphopantetheinyl transferase
MMLYANAGAGAVDWPIHEGGRIVLATAENEIHLWRAPLDISPEKLRGLEIFLQPDERERAARFRFPQHRERFTAARGILRAILGLHLGCAPENLRFIYGEHGKPALAEPAGAGVEFNLSHSAGLAIYAVARGRRVGVDVERVKSEGSWLQIAEQYFTAAEAAELAALPGEAMRNRFFQMWSAKEARLKALGLGLRFPLEDAGDAASWPVIQLCPMLGYSAALAFDPEPAEPAIIRHHFAA